MDGLMDKTINEWMLGMDGMVWFVYQSKICVPATNIQRLKFGLAPYWPVRLISISICPSASHISPPSKQICDGPVNGGDVA